MFVVKANQTPQPHWARAPPSHPLEFETRCWKLGSQSDQGDPPRWRCYSLAQVSHSSHHRVAPAHTSPDQHPGRGTVSGVESGGPGTSSIGACMAPMGPTYPSVCEGSSNSLKHRPAALNHQSVTHIAHTWWDLYPCRTITVTYWILCGH